MYLLCANRDFCSILSHLNSTCRNSFRVDKTSSIGYKYYSLLLAEGYFADILVGTGVKHFARQTHWWPTVEQKQDRELNWTAECAH